MKITTTYILVLTSAVCLTSLTSAMEPHEVAQALEDALTEVNSKIEQSQTSLTEEMHAYKAGMEAEMEGYRSVIRDLARQTMLMQFNMEERVRSDGDSGVKLLRSLENGPENYYTASHVSNSFNSIHDHSNYNSTVGMGEIIAVLNGVEFRTRHNDYKLQMASTTSTDYHATENIPFPEVPKSVTDKPTVDEQITEMREWFKAFATQNATHRPYPDHFKPILCYLEGAWTLDTDLEEPFSSDRHQIDASSWFDLQDKVRFSSYTGTKSRLENFSHLPTTIMSVNETTGVPNYAQWNYRILCSPLQEDIPTSELRMQDDLSHRVPRGKSVYDMKFSRGARFSLYENDKDRFTKYSKMDRLFYSIPGKDNLPAANMSQASFGDKMFSLAQDEDVPLNTGYYHRYFRFDKDGAMGQKSVSRGYNDQNMWVAQTTQNRVAPIGLKVCERKRVPHHKNPDRLVWKQVCDNLNTRFSYAIPLEIIYLTPLMAWNPYNIETGKPASVVTGNGQRNGQHTKNGNPWPEKAYNGTDYQRHYLTPVAFFKGRVDQSDSADTVRSAVGVLDRQGVMRKTTASGIKIVLQEIEGVGPVRLRYPIAPVHGEGSSVWKELNALKHVVRDTYIGNGPPDTVGFVMSTTFTEPPQGAGTHNHEFSVSFEDFRAMIDEGKQVEVVTESAHDHSHAITVYYNKNKESFDYIICDGQAKWRLCWDKHPRGVSLTSDVVIERGFLDMF